MDAHMPTIQELPDTGKFNIKAASRNTGVPSVTLRAWERRYEVLDPHRAKNGYRQYSERDIAILSWLKSQVDAGVSISSAVNEFKSNANNGIWPEFNQTITSQRKMTHSDLPAQAFSQQLFEALIKHDELSASRLFGEAGDSFDLIELFESVIFPVLVRIGEGWFEGKILVATEHFASGFFRAKLHAIFQSMPPGLKKQRIMVGGATGELHEIGSLMVSILLREAGYRVEYLGPDIPLEDLLLYISSEKPRMIILSATLVESTESLAKFQDKLKKLRPTPLFGYGGAAFNNNPKLTEQIPGVFLGRSLSQTIEKVKTLLA
jgi:MerR family transcriptional regulator, light-induced transcriptional regulator